MRFLGATTNEVLFVGFLIGLVLIAPRVAPLGERIGRLFARERAPGSNPPRDDS
jgi:hypothetical protein